MTFVIPGNLKIIGVGGCGKKLVHKICEHEWFLHKYLESQDRLGIYTIDTATGDKDKDNRFFVELPTDAPSVQHIIPLSRRINEIRASHNLAGTIDLGHYHLPDYAGQLRVLEDLCTDDVAQRIRTVAGQHLNPVDVWWMHDLKNGIDARELVQKYPDLTNGFNGGVYRMRAASKAVFYKAISENPGRFIQFHTGDHVAIVVGLGGGTGSGIFLDLVEYARKRNVSSIWIYAILPAPTEPEKERLNAAVALTELEYLNTHHPELPLHIVISSLERTKYTGTKGGALNYLADFDNAFPYTFLNSILMSGENLTALQDAEKSYSRFIFANSGVVEYQYETVNSVMSDIEDLIADCQVVLEKKMELLEFAKDIFEEQIREFPTQYQPNTIQQISVADENAYQLEISRIRKIWNLAAKLRYESGNTLKVLDERVTAPLDFNVPNPFREQLAYVSEMKLGVDNNNPRIQDTTDSACYSLIKSYFKYLQDLGHFYLDVLHLVDRAALDSYMGVAQGVVDITAVQHLVISKINESNQIIGDTDAEISETTNGLEDLKSQKLTLWKQINNLTASGSMLSNINKYLDHEKKREDWVKHETDFIVHLNKLMEALNKKLQCAYESANLRRRDRAGRYGREEWLNLPEFESFQSNGGNFNGDILGLETLLKRYYYCQYMIAVAAYDHGSLLQRPINVHNLTGEQATLLENICAVCANYSDYITYGTEPFSLTVSPGIMMSEFNSKSKLLLDSILLPVMDTFDLNDEEMHELKSSISLRKSDDEVDVSTTTIFDSSLYLENLRSTIYTITGTHRHDYDDLISLENENLENEVEIRSVSENLMNYFVQIRDSLLISSSGMRLDAQDLVDSLNTRFNGLEERIGNLGTMNETGSPYKNFAGGRNNASLLHLFRQRNAQNLALSVFDEDDHAAENVRGEIEASLNALAGKLIEPESLGLSEFSSTAWDGNNPSVWTFPKSVFVVCSKSEKLTNHFMTTNMAHHLRGTIANSAHGGNLEDAYSASHNSAQPWDTAFTFFISAGFIDLISQFSIGGRYRGPYVEGGKHNLMHHVLGLEQGHVYLRNGGTSLDVEDEFTQNEATKVAYRERSPRTKSSAVDRIKELYTEETLSDCLSYEESLAENWESDDDCQ